MHEKRVLARVSNTKNTITINGRTYDARTGTVISDVQNAITPSAVVHVAKSNKKAHKRIIQDIAGPVVIRPTQPAKPKPAQPVAIKTSAQKPKSQKAARQHQATTAHSIHASSQKAGTLMRQVVHKPSFVKPSPAQPAIYTSSKSTVVTPRKLINNTPHRAERAHAIPQSKLISKFSTTSQIPTVVKRAAALPVKQPTAVANSVQHNTTKAIKHQPPQHMSTPAEDLFMKAIANANSHQQPHAIIPKHAKRSRRLGKRILLNIGASVVIVGLIGGFFAYQAAPKLALRNATKQAGIAVSVPHFVPSGFAMQKPSTPAPGTLVLNFRSRSDGRSYSISQQQSNLTSEALRDSVATTSQGGYQTYESNGQMIYVYSANATWVKNGTQFTIEGNSSLTTDQVLRIAASF